MLLVSVSPSGALASHSSIVRVGVGCGFGYGERIVEAGVLERLAAIKRRFHLQLWRVGDFSRILSYLNLGPSRKVLSRVISLRTVNLSYSRHPHRSRCTQARWPPAPATHHHTIQPRAVSSPSIAQLGVILNKKE